MKKTELADALARYILEFEEDDFRHYCEADERKHHIYLKAYEYQYGEQAAKNLLLLGEFK